MPIAASGAALPTFRRSLAFERKHMPINVRASGLYPPWRRGSRTRPDEPMRRESDGRRTKALGGELPSDDPAIHDQRNVDQTLSRVLRRMLATLPRRLSNAMPASRVAEASGPFPPLQEDRPRAAPAGGGRCARQSIPAGRANFPTRNEGARSLPGALVAHSATPGFPGTNSP